MSDVFSKCHEFRNNYFENNGFYPDEIELSHDELNQLRNSFDFFSYPTKPQPPVKKRVDRTISGLFFSDSHHEIEYDFHAPEYLESLESWKTYQKEFRDSCPNGMVLGMKIRIKAMS